MLLKNKTAVVYGGGGPIGAAVAKAFAKEGAMVFIAGRTSFTLEAIVGQITANGGIAEMAVVDAFDKTQVLQHLDYIIEKTGSIDIFFNAVGIGGKQGLPLAAMNYEDFVLPVINAMKSHFNASTIVSEYMARKNGGVILTITANAARKPYPDIGGFGVACAAIEGFCRQLAFEQGRHGVRVICLRSAGSPDTPGVNEVFNLHAANAGISREEFDAAFAERTMLKKLPALAEVADAAVLMASDKAGAVTAAVINITCGELAD